MLTELVGSDVYLYLELAGASVTARAAGDTPYHAGDPVKIGIDMMKIHLFDGDTGKSLV